MLASAIASGTFANLMYLVLYNNRITNHGMVSFSDAISNAPGALGSLVHLVLSSNAIGDAGLISFADAVRKNGVLANCQRLYLHGSRNRIGGDGLKALASAVATGGLPALQTVMVPTGSEEHPALVAAFEPRGVEII